MYAHSLIYYYEILNACLVESLHTIMKIKDSIQFLLKQILWYCLKAASRLALYSVYFFSNKYLLSLLCNHEKIQCFQQGK